MVIKANLIKNSGKSLMPLKTICIYIYIHGLTDRIFNTATKQQNQFHLQVFPSTFCWLFFIFNLPEKNDSILCASY
jgi:hypothetical protein